MDTSAKRLKAMIPLRHHVKVLVPSTIDVSRSDAEAANKERDWVDRVAEFLSARFGGATVTPALGCWISPQHGLIKERVTVVEAFCTEEALNASIDAVVGLAEDMKAGMSQEAVAIEVDNEMYFV